MNIAVLYAVAVEGWLLNETRFSGHSVCLYETGMGKVNAAHVCTLAIERQRPDLVISTGICGAYPDTGLVRGDVAVARREIYGDEGVVLADGFVGLEEIGIALFRDGQREWFNVFDLDQQLVDYATGQLGCLSGTFLTLSTCTGTLARAMQYKEMFAPLCENMEGAAIAHVCVMTHTPVLELRGVSNIVQDRDLGTWDIKEAAKNSQQAVIRLINSLPSEATRQFPPA
ncbi:MAG: futalosine hydrolase [Candidatus Magnetobacterium sp. LHC-1]|uniref:Futalosine hydrolase n=1 Tax=Candidatus Magnetobacterium casense TaxID=1455061 RepID=A0ABS6RYT5_9BACT|nr:futalosine hydrolase [Candidatus Magnetobacterium casensis]MBF0608328.1 futalosine hydrolase [Nitrospirota bacterium]MBV6340953.1 futalosine hydrolase [Candidatus Magnetobacterium casensis]